LQLLLDSPEFLLRIAKDQSWKETEGEEEINQVTKFSCEDKGSQKEEQEESRNIRRSNPDRHISTQPVLSRSPKQKCPTCFLLLQGFDRFL